MLYLILIDQYVLGKEVEIDLIFDGEDVFILIYIEYIEWVGVYLGDSFVIFFGLFIINRLQQGIKDVV